MQSLEALNLVPVWLNPDHIAMTARILLAGHRLKVLGVLEGAELVGVVTVGDAQRMPDQALVRDFMMKPPRPVDVSTPLRQLADTFWQEDYDFLPVLQGDKFRGIVTPNMLLKEMARSWDPLTGLSWSDRLREWGVDNLKQGREITILFIDLDRFGSYNKKYGHIIGDRVLQKVAQMIQERTEPERDQVVRYGGDEFAIGTIRDQVAASDLASSLREGMTGLRVAGSDEPVTFSIGVQGGKRTKERENVHYAATLDNLINLASKNSMAEKAARARFAPAESYRSEPETYFDETDSQIEPTSETAVDVAESHGESFRTDASLPDAHPSETEIEVAESHSPVEPSPAPEPEVEASPMEPPAATPMRIADVFVDAADANSVTQVSIRGDGITVTGICPRKGGSVVKSVALATANALSQIRPGLRMVPDISLTESESGERFISVSGAATIDGEEITVRGVGTVGRNLYQAVAEATLQAYTNFESGD